MRFTGRWGHLSASGTLGSLNRCKTTFLLYCCPMIACAHSSVVTCLGSPDAFCPCTVGEKTPLMKIVPQSRMPAKDCLRFGTLRPNAIDVFRYCHNCNFQRNTALVRSRAMHTAAPGIPVFRALSSRTIFGCVPMAPSRTRSSLDRCPCSQPRQWPGFIRGRFIPALTSPMELLAWRPARIINRRVVRPLLLTL